MGLTVALFQRTFSAENDERAATAKRQLIVASVAFKFSVKNDGDVATLKGCAHYKRGGGNTPITNP